MLKIGFKGKLIIASLLIVILTIGCMAGANFIHSKNTYRANGLAVLENVSETLHSTISMQQRLAERKIMSDLNIFESIMGVSGLPMFEMLYDVDMTITDQLTGMAEQVTIPAFKLGSKYLHESTALVDSMHTKSGVLTSVLQLNNDKLIRVSSTLPYPGKDSAQGVYIPSDAEAYKAILAGERYEGLATVGDQWYVVAYEGVRNFDEKVIGALEVARPVISEDFASFITATSVGGKGYSFVFRSDTTVPAAPADTSGVDIIIDHVLNDEALAARGGTVGIDTDTDTLWANVVHFEPWDAYLVTTIAESQLLEGVNRQILISAAESAILPLVLAVLIILFISRQLVAPLNSLAEVADNVTKGNFDCEFSYKGDDVLGRTMKSVQSMVGEIKQQLGFSRGVLNGVTIPCSVVDLDNNVTHINQAAVSVLGKRKEPEAYLGESFNEVVYHDAKRKTLTQVAMKKREQVSWEVELKRDIDDMTVILHVVSTPIYDFDGDLIGAITIWVDLTEERRQQQAVDAKNKVIEEAAMGATSIAHSVSESAGQLSETIRSAQEGALKQRDLAAEVSSAMTQMSASAVQVSENAALTATLSEETSSLARSGSEVVKRSVEMMQVVHNRSEGLQAKMDELGNHVSGVGAIMGVITDIADQTNLLALNAAIEAARAGEAGRGFAVVADEVRKLAEKTMDATKEVGNNIAAIQASANESIRSTQEANESLVECRELVEESGDSLQAIVDKANESASQVLTIASAADQQSKTSEQINKATNTVNSIAEETAQTMDASSTEVTALTDLATKLRKAIDRMQQ